MQTLTNTRTEQLFESSKEKAAFDWHLFFRVVGLIVCGSFTAAIYSPPINAAALGVLVGLFYYCLHTQDPVSFFIQLIIGNFFSFGGKLGGNYNIAAFASIIFFLAINGKITFLKSSIFSNNIKTSMFIWGIFGLLSIIGGNLYPLFTELQSFFGFFMMLYLFYFTSRIPFTEKDIFKILVSISIFFGYEFLVAFNQKYTFYDSPYPFFPILNKDIDFYMGIARSGSTLDNFEAFAEFCVSLISLLLPGILSGSSIKKSRPFYILGIATIFLSVMSIILSGTRSSIVLLPLAVITTFVLLGKRLKTKFVVLLVTAVLGLFILNQVYKVIDTSVFAERNEGMDMNDITVAGLISGESMNRGGLFPYALEEVKKTGIIGRGYFTGIDEYRGVQIKKGDMDDSVADYHNLYMASYVLWGPIGFFAIMFLLFYPLWMGWKTYWKLRKTNHFLIDLLLGFNVLFFYFLINEFKIQFIRAINYFSITMFLLALYIFLIWMLQQKSTIERIQKESQ